MDKEKYAIGVDWLQTFGHCEAIKDGSYDARGYQFLVRKLDRETALFTRVLEAVLGGRRVALIYQCPRTSVINPKATGIKLENRVLYHQRYIELLYALQEAVNFHYKGITRLDLCYDCNRLHGGRDVERFIKQFVNAEPMTRGHIVRRGSSRFSLHGSKNSTSVPSYSSIRFGSPVGRIGAYCYNKTLELLEVKDKPHIRKWWEMNGLVSTIDRETMETIGKKKLDIKRDEDSLAEYVNVPVWRFEISIKCQAQDILNLATGQLFQLSPEYLKSQERVEYLFHVYAKKVFDFRVNAGNKRIRDYKPMQLFEDCPKLTDKPYYMSKFVDTGRMERICYNKLEKLSDEYSDLSDTRRKSIYDTMQWLRELVTIKTARLKTMESINYLNSLNAHRTYEDDIDKYLAVVELSTMARKHLDPEYFWHLMVGYRKGVPNMPPEPPDNPGQTPPTPYDYSFLG